VVVFLARASPARTLAMSIERSNSDEDATLCGSNDEPRAQVVSWYS